ncbi:MAG: hypothetical protein JEY97_05275 [Bacteroidales bacterium]|nr:hypothetical protein [Bacteroidales bacterium]
MKRKIKINKTIIAEETEIGVGLILPLEKLSPPIIKLLRRNYNQDPTCITGDIEFLFSFDGIGIME